LGENKDKYGIHSINIKKLLILNKDRFLALSNAIKYGRNFYSKEQKNFKIGCIKPITFTPPRSFKHIPICNFFWLFFTFAFILPPPEILLSQKIVKKLAIFDFYPKKLIKLYFPNTKSFILLC